MASQVPDERTLLQEVLMQSVAGGTAGCVEVSLMHPLDVIKTRFQLPDHEYRGVLHCARKMRKGEGIPAFWKGVLPPILVQTPKRAYKFLCFEQFRHFFNTFDHGLHPAAVAAASGLTTGMTEAALVNPTEVIKVKMQLDRARQDVAPTTRQAAKEILHEDGWLRGGLIGKGITASMLRDGTWNMVYFGLYHGGKLYFPALPEDSPKALELLRRFSLGLVAGTVASVLNIPFDVAKSRIQGPQDKIQYSNSTLKTVYDVAKAEGVGALYTGLVPKIMRYDQLTFSN